MIVKTDFFNKIHNSVDVDIMTSKVSHKRFPANHFTTLMAE